VPNRLHSCQLVVAVALAATLTSAAPALAQSKRPLHRHGRHHVVKPRVASGRSTTHGPSASATQILPVAAGCTDGDLTPTPENLDRVSAATLCIVNEQRAMQGEAPLRPNAALAGAASRHTSEMLARNYFAHIGPAGDSPLERLRAAGYVHPSTAFQIGENIAWGTGALATAAATVQSWMRSPEHRANILTAAYRDSGIGVAPGAISMAGADGSGAMYTQDFGTTG